jgi:hypothetical protein
MLKRILNAIGDWNPQLLREWQGRFKPWDVTGAFAVSAIVQFIFLTNRRAKLPQTYSDYHPYCTGPTVPLPNDPYNGMGPYDPQCLKDAAGYPLTNWQDWWQESFTPLTHLLVGAVIVASVYWLISDFIFEERRGTLNFVRLSPRSGKEILWGKLLGVPTLVYVALLTALPLHLYTAVQGQVPFSVLMGTYIVGAASCVFFASGALLWSVTTSGLGYLQPWAGAGFAALTVSTLMTAPFPYGHLEPLSWLAAFDPSIMTKHLLAQYSLDQFKRVAWFGLEYNASPWSTMIFTTLYLGVWTYWVWQALLRRFQNPRGTALSKRQSYGFTACLIGSLVGFAGTKESLILTTLNMGLIMCLVTVTLITPNRQTLQEWARYRHHLPRKALFSELLWGEKSPALLAVAVNMAIATTLLLPIAAPSSWHFGEGILQLLSLAIAVLLLAAIFQAMLMVRMARPELWAVGSWMVCWIAPVTVANLFGVFSSDAIWIFSIAPWLAVGSVPAITVLGVVLAQLSTFGLLTYRLTRQLDRAGASESKALLT